MILASVWYILNVASTSHPFSLSGGWQRPGQAAPLANASDLCQRQISSWSCSETVKLVVSHSLFIDDSYEILQSIYDALMMMMMMMMMRMMMMMMMMRMRMRMRMMMMMMMMMRRMMMMMMMRMRMMMMMMMMRRRRRRRMRMMMRMMMMMRRRRRMRMMMMRRRRRRMMRMRMRMMMMMMMMMMICLLKMVRFLDESQHRGHLWPKHGSWSQDFCPHCRSCLKWNSQCRISRPHVICKGEMAVEWQFQLYFLLKTFEASILSSIKTMDTSWEEMPLKLAHWSFLGLHIPDPGFASHVRSSRCVLKDGHPKLLPKKATAGRQNWPGVKLHLKSSDLRNLRIRMTKSWERQL